MSQETKKYNEDYLNSLIAKAKKSWEGVDIDSFMSELRDNDMTSIEERAYKYAEAATWDDVDGCPPDIYATNAFNAYFEGATEQKAIDEKVRLKKCDDMTKAEYDREVAFADWYLKNGKGTPTYSDAIEWARKDAINKALDWLSHRYFSKSSPVAEEFRKAMEK